MKRQNPLEPISSRVEPFDAESHWFEAPSEGFSQCLLLFHGCSDIKNWGSFGMQRRFDGLVNVDKMDKEIWWFLHLDDEHLEHPSLSFTFYWHPRVNHPKLPCFLSPPESWKLFWWCPVA